VRIAFLAAIPAAACALLLAACGGNSELGGGGIPQGNDVAAGKELFIQSCGACHAMADAGTQGTVGPNMDDAFAGSRAQGFEESTFEQVLRWHIAFPGIGLGMPANLVVGEDADNVAAYVARYAGNPDIAPSGGGGTDSTDGKTIFAQNCGSCHTLAAAGTQGQVGPNLDETKPARDLVVDRVTNGQGAMPAFKDQLSEEQIQAVADFVAP
jgi:mono/diheme cytochrome c family protein